jgi:hypothetical protein
MLALLAGCGSASTTSVPATSNAAVRAAHAALLYASSDGEVDVFDFPSGTKIGQLSGFDFGFDKEGLCADSAGDVFVAGTVRETGQVYEFTVGSQTPAAKLATHGFADSCSVDPKTGNLAVAEYYYPAFGDGDVAVFADAQGDPTYYSDPNGRRFTDCAYDNSGNLFISIFRAGELLELTNGSQSFQTIALNHGGVFSGSLQWYKNELIVASWYTEKSPENIERVKISNGTATILGTTVLSTGHNKRSVGEYAVDGANIVGPDENDKYLAMWKYPAGGRSTKNLGRGNGHWKGTVIVR